MESSMRKSPLFAFAALLCASALPAVAAVHELGSVNVSADHFTNVTWSQFEGPVDRLSFLPATDAVDCNHITINYLDGTSHNVFTGRLLKNQRETISFPGDQDRRLASVDFSCRAENLDGARIALSAVTDGDRWTNGDDAFDRSANLDTYEGAEDFSGR
jgi:hypothetical protein